MSNMFDDFLEELRRRQAQRDGSLDRSSGSNDPADDGADTEGAPEDATMRSDGPDSDDTDRGEDGGPSPIYRRSGGFGGGSRRYAGGPTDGMPEIQIGRGWVIIGIIAVAIVILLTVFASTVGVTGTLGLAKL